MLDAAVTSGAPADLGLQAAFFYLKISHEVMPVRAIVHNNVAVSLLWL